MTIETGTGSPSTHLGGSEPTNPTNPTTPTTATDQQGSSPAADLATSAKESASAVASRAGSEVRSLTDEAAGKARDVLGDARSQLKTQAAEQASRAAGSVHQLAGQLSSMAGAAEPGIARDLAEQAAEQADRFAGRLDREGIDSILADLRRFARNQPGIFLLGAAAAGALTGRLLKSVDTHALVEAAKPSTDQPNGELSSSNQWPTGALSTGAGTTGGDDTVDLTAGTTPSPAPSTTSEPAWAPGSQR